METLTLPVISTGHLSAKDAVMLEELARIFPPGPLSVGEDNYGFWLYVLREAAEPATQAYLDQLGLGSSVVKIMTWALKNGFTYIRLDRDADLVEDAVAAGELEEHDW